MSTQDYLDFELNVESLAENRLKLTVLNSPVGSVSTETVNPFTPEDVARVIDTLGGASRVSRGEAARIARSFGERLFGAIFTGQIYAAYLASLTQAGERGLRVKLGLANAGALEDWPWEMLRDPSGDYLALSRQTPIIRFPRVLTARPLVEVALPLRVLVLISSPNDLEALDVEGEWKELQDATAELRLRGLLELERVDNAQLNTLQRRLRGSTSFQVFHYIGHAAYDEKSEQGSLAFEDPRTEGTMLVSGEGLARELAEENSIRLVVLNACQGARQSRSDPYAGIASSIVARGVPAVVAMQFEISDNAARVFAAEFYRALSEGYPIEAAMAEARRAIASTLNNLEWATPVLYLRAPTGMLFPRRRSHDARLSTGGLRERLFQPALIGALLAFVFLVCAIISLVNGTVPLLGIVLRPTETTAPPTATTTPSLTPTVRFPTLTPTPPGAALDVDLSVVSVRFLPPDPAPGELATIAVRIQNNGTSNSGPFSWVWFASNPQEDPEPALQDQVANLGPGLSTTIITNYRFPWWGVYTTTAWVNFDSRIPETNIFNNFTSRTVTTGNRSFNIDFSVQPDGTLLEPGTLEGTEFAAWNLSLAADPGTSCAGVVPNMYLDDDINTLGTQRTATPNECLGQPLAITATAPDDGPPLMGVSVAFVATVPGGYTLSLFETVGGAAIQTASVDVTSAGNVEELAATVEGGAFARLTAILTGPAGSTTAIRRVSFVRTP